MALLRRLRSAPASARLFLLLTSASLAGCVILEALRGEEEGLTFPHRVHVEDEGLDCGDCHLTVEDEEEPGMPVLGQCMLCHEDIDAEKPPEERIAVLFDGDRIRARAVSRLEGEIVFPHQAHVGYVEDCATCHEGIAGSERIEERVAVTMDECMDCHAQRGAPNECSTCHSVLREDVAPGSHEDHWLRFHGKVFRAGGREADRCSLCHEEQDDCQSCHLSTPPENHDNFWRLKGHGLVARMDRQNCAACHRSDSCDQCHSETLPLNHSGMWGSPKDTHCLSCHFPLRSESCFVCHQGTPSHAMAPPMPPWHNPGMNCRQCHGVDVPLIHVDKGDNCLLCHR